MARKNRSGVDWSDPVSVAAHQKEYYRTKRYTEPDIPDLGRATGERHGRSKLTDQDVRDIRAAYVPRSVSFAAIARMYGVDASVIEKIVKRKTWKHID